MFCKFCGEEIEPQAKECPVCGQKVVGADGWKIAVVILGALILSAVLVVAVLFGTGVLGGKAEKADKPNDKPSVSAGYTNDKQAAKKADVVVATCGDYALTNGELQFHYWAAVMNFLNENYYYLSYMGLDLSQNLADQPCAMDQTKSWEEYFLEQALESWRSYAMLCMRAQEEGYELDAEGKAYLDGLDEEIANEATANQYASVKEMLLEQAGPGATLDGLKGYRSTLYFAMQFFATCYEKFEPTEQEIIAYWEENSAEFADTGITKDSGRYGSVRHILIKPEGGTQDPNTGYMTYTDEEMAAAKARAEEVLDLWKKGDATEQSFVALVSEYTDDPGSMTTGGLYEDIGQNSGYVAPFEAWAIDPARQVGDTGIVEVKEVHYSGYHIMYYAKAGQEFWYKAVSDTLLNDRVTQFITEGLELYPLNTDYEKIVLGSVDLGM